MKLMYMILIKTDDGQWTDCGEGPFNARSVAEDFARCEVAAPWIVARIETADTAATMETLSRRNA